MRNKNVRKQKGCVTPYVIAASFFCRYPKRESSLSDLVPPALSFPVRNGPSVEVPHTDLFKKNSSATFLQWREENCTHIQIGSKAQPAKVRHERPPRDFVDLTPGVGQVRRHAEEGDDVDGGEGGLFELEEGRHPGEVESELDGVERRAVL